MIRTLLLALLCAAPVLANDPGLHLTRYGAGAGPALADGTLKLLDDARSPQQSNAAAYDQAQPGAFEQVRLRCALRIGKGGEGGAIAFLSTREYGVRGPAPFQRQWVAPDLRGSFAVGLDVHDPPNRDPFRGSGNVMGLPQREVSLHWDGREIVKRLAPKEFRGDFGACEVALDHVVGGALVTVRLGGAAVYDRYFVPQMRPYPCRLAFGAQTSTATTVMDVKDVRFQLTTPARRRRPPLVFDVFNHVLTNNKQTAYQATVDLPPPTWAFGRVLATIEIHDAGRHWDEWDRCGEVFVVRPDGTKLGVVPFITSYRTACRWTVDLTDLRPLLAGKTTLEIAAGTTFYKNRGYMMSLTLEYHHGRPALVPYQVETLWHGTARYRSAENHFKDFFTDKTVTIPADARAARVRTTTTGHSQVGEFTPSRRELVFEAAGKPAARFANTLWRVDCYLNPNRPQYGTWKYPRAGWAPGDVVRPWWVELTPHLAPGQATLRYVPHPYDFSRRPKPPTTRQIAAASHIVRSFLIFYRPPTDQVAAPSLRLTGVRKGSAAAKAGLRPGDYLARYDGRLLGSVDELRAALKAAKAAGKATVKLVAYRGAKRLEVDVATGGLGVNLATR